MICKKCGAELAENAKFCGMCGSRIDGKKPCGICGQLVDEGHSFCVYCGAELIATKQEIFQKKRVKENMAISANAEVASKQMDRETLFNLIGNGLLVLGALVAFIFMFFIGITGEMAGSVSDFEKLGINIKGANIFYFFGDFFDEYKLLKNSALGYFKPEILANSLIYGITGMLIAIVVFIAVSVFACLSVGTYIASVLGKTQKRSEKWSMLAICSFIVGCVVFKILHTVNIDIISNASSVNGLSLTGIKFPLKTVLNRATKAGIILCLLCLGLYSVCKLFSVKKGCLSFSKILPVAVAFLGLVCVIVSIFVVQNYGMSTKWEIREGQTYTEMRIVFSFLQASILGLPLANSAIGSMGTVQNIEDFTDKIRLISTCNCIAQVLTIGLAICLVFSLWEKIKGTAVEKNEKVGLTFSIISCVLCFILLVVFIISCVSAMDVFNIATQELSNESLSGVSTMSVLDEETQNQEILFISVGRLMVLLVFSLVNLAISVWQRILVKKTVYEEV